MKKIILFVKQLLGITEKPKAIGQFQTWYGRVNKWRKSRSTLEKDILECAERGVSGYMIEMAVWADNDLWTDKGLKSLEKDYENILSLCRAEGLWLFVSVVNDNMGKGKYGDKGPALEKVYDKALKLLEIIKKHGKDNVIVQPVAETQTSAGKKFEAAAKSVLAGFPLVNNNNGGQPSGTNGMNFAAYHPSAISKKVGSGFLAISDHGLIIRELNKGGSLEAQGDPAKVTQWKNNVKAWGCPVCGYYAFLYDGFDKDTIKALGK